MGKRKTRIVGVMEHQLIIEKVPSSCSESPIQGNRVVELAYLINKAVDLQFTHSKICTSGKLTIQEEFRSLVWGTLASGSTFGHTTELISAMDIPSMPYYVFHEIENSLAKVWRGSLWEHMENAGKIEKRLAVEAGQIGTDGIPWIRVYLDGSWSKRPYGLE